MVYWIVILAMAEMMFFIKEDNNLGKEIVSAELKVKRLSPYTNFVMILSFIVVLSNVYQFFMSNGIPPYGGSGEPARFTANLSKSSQYWDDHHWYENFINGKSSFLGTNQGPKPWIAGVNEKSIKLNTDFKELPFTVKTEPLKILRIKEVKFQALSAFKKGIAGGIACDKANNEFAIISTGGAIYFTDKNFEKYNAFATLDQVNGMDIPLSVDANYYGAGKVVATAYNKTIWGVEKTQKDKIDPKFQWKFLRDVDGDLLPMFKGKRIAIMTTGVKKAYVLSLAKDPDSRYAYMLSIAVKKSPNVILLKFDTKDNQISEESILEFSPNLEIKKGAKTNEFYITGSDIINNKMFAISKSFNALIIIDLATKSIENAYALPQIGDAHDIAIKNNELFILSRDKNKDKVFVLNNPIN